MALGCTQSSAQALFTCQLPGTAGFCSLGFAQLHAGGFCLFVPSSVRDKNPFSQAVFSLQAL